VSGVEADRQEVDARVDWDVIAGRPPFAVDWAAVTARMQGRTVLVTGAGGSLGAPLCQALAQRGPANLVLYDHHESSLFRLRQRLAPLLPDGAVHAMLGDVRAPRRVRQLFAAHRPDLVFHLAAYKHVPWGEEDPEAFAEANVLGGQVVLDAARAHETAQIVYPSTDKAVDPPSLYGATKRLVEGMLQAAARSGGPRCAIVRFVNVLGSQGSAPETFIRRILAGETLPITHMKMRRYWITPDHARLMLLHAACLQDEVAVVAPDAGDEVATVDIARRLYAILRPGQPGPELVVTGLRPGERLAEPLSAPYEALGPAPLPGLRRVLNVSPVPPEVVGRAVAELQRLLDEGAGGPAIRAALFDACRPLESRAGG
jgi:FlaA1/EpsC-like NDP-sugar epimerase